MIELTFIALLHRLLNWGFAPIIATRVVAADGAAVHDFLADGANHWRLGARGGAPRGGAVSVRASRSGEVLWAEVRLPRAGSFFVTWLLSPGRGTTEVDAAVQFESRRLLLRLALVLGGRRLVARRLDGALASLAQMCVHAAEDLPSAVAPSANMAPWPSPDVESAGSAAIA
jgi:hypothetical protein